MAGRPLPLLLMLCGVEERRREMIRTHQPIDRIFDVVDIGILSDQEVREFFEKAFASVQMKIEPAALDILTEYSAGFPKIMHLLGDCAFWIDKDMIVDEKDAWEALMVGAEEVGRKYVDQQVYRALNLPANTREDRKYAHFRDKFPEKRCGGHAQCSREKKIQQFPSENEIAERPPLRRAKGRVRVQRQDGQALYLAAKLRACGQAAGARPRLKSSCRCRSAIGGPAGSSPSSPPHPLFCV